MYKLIEPDEAYDFHCDCQKEPEERPLCSMCKKEIEEDFYYQVNDDIYCKHCIRKMVVYF